MHHVSGHNYRNSSFIVDVAMGQIPYSTKRISSFMKTLISLTLFLVDCNRKDESGRKCIVVLCRSAEMFC